jgi:hypothetical protein
MRIAAGVILIIAAIVNIIGGAGYVLGGAVTSTAGHVGSEAAKESAKEGVKDKELEKASDKAKKTGGAWMAFGLFLFVLVGLQIAGAVVLFMSKAKIFVFIVAGLSILAEIIGMVNVGFVFWQLFGLAGGILAGVAAVLYKPKDTPQPLPA